MHLTSLLARQFRSYDELRLEPDPGLNLFLGLNGSGKTNIVEAIAVLATGISPRGADMESLVRWGDNGFFLKGVFSFDGSAMDPLSLEMRYVRKTPRVIRQNGDKPLRLKELIGKAPLVSFVPEDLALVKGEPELRRRAVNMVLSQVDPGYVAALSAYSDAVRARNAALRQVAEGHIGAAEVEPWSRAIITAGVPIFEKRARLMDDFSPRVSRLYERISGGRERLQIVYEPSLSGPWGDGSRWRSEMDARFSNEVAAGATLIGPHRDEFRFLLDGRSAKAFASEGQKRSCAVAFKLAEVSYFREKTGHRPIVILDDVLSELDAERARHLLDELSGAGQCFVTLAGVEAWPRDRRLPATVFRVSETGVQRSLMREEELAHPRRLAFC